MSLTRAMLETTLLRRCSSIMARVGLDSITSNGTNADLDDPIRIAMRDLGFNIIDPLVVADADLVPVTGVYIDRLLDASEMRILETCLNNLTDVNMGLGEERQDLGQLGIRLQQRINQLIDKMRRPVGVDVTGGVVKRFAVGRERNSQTRHNPLGWPYS